MDRKLGLGVIVQDLIKGTSIYDQYIKLGNNDCLSRDELDSIQFSKFKKIVSHAYTNVPYYKRTFNEVNLHPSHIKCLDDIEKIPILTKDLARKHQADLIASNIKDYSVKKGKTGGTTGIPLEILKDEFDRSVTWASYYRWYRWIGIKQNDKTLSLWGAKTVLSSSLRSKLYFKFSDYILNNVTVNSFGISPDNIRSYYDFIITSDPKLIKGYLSSIFLISQFMKSNSLPPNKSLKALACTTETLLPEVRSFIESVFQVPLYDQYGCGEVSSIAFECKNKNKHITQEHVYLEVLDESNSSLTGTPGRLIVTGLDNFVMPFIRYENGDVSSLLNETCSCNLPHKLLGDIEGRTIDTVTLSNGTKVHGVFFTDIFHELGYNTSLIKRFQIIQMPDLAIKLLLEVDEDLSPASIESILRAISRFVKVDSIKQTNFIENSSSGKFRYIVSG